MSSYSDVPVSDLAPRTEDLQDTAQNRALRWRPSAATLTVALVTCGAAILRSSFLGSKSLWLDEAYTAHLATMSLSSLRYILTHGQMNMSLYYLLIWGWTHMAGDSEFMLRLPLALFGIVTVPLIYLLGTELEDLITGLWAAVLTAINATFILWGQTARRYAMFVALATLASLLFIRSLGRESPLTPVGYIASGTSSVYAHLFAIFAVLSQWLSLFLFRPIRKKAIVLSICMCAIGILSLPAFYYAISGDFGNEAWVPRTSLESPAGVFLMYVGRYNQSVTILTLLLLAFYSTGIILAIVRASRNDLPVLGYLLLSIFLPIALTIMVSLVKPLFMSRYLLVGMPFFILLAVIGFQRLSRRFAIGLVAIVAGLSLIQDYSYYNSEPIQDWRGAVEFIASNSHAGDSLASYPSHFAAPIHYYLRHRGDSDKFPAEVYPDLKLPPREAAKHRRFLAVFENLRDQRVWLVFATWRPPDDNDLRLILAETRIVQEPHFAGLRLLLLERKREA